MSGPSVGVEGAPAARHIGIVGCTEESAALCYHVICTEGARLMGPNMHPEVTVHTYPQGAYDRLIAAGDWAGVATLMLSSAAKLASAGAELVICPDNVLHQAFDRVVPRSPLPWLHMVDEVAAEAVRQGYATVGVLGTRQVMDSTLYPGGLAARGIAARVPAPEERQRIDAIIRGELVHGLVLDGSRHYLAGVIDGLAASGCHALVIGCTKLPLLLDAGPCPLPCIDSKRLLAQAALREALSPGRADAGMQRGE